MPKRPHLHQAGLKLATDGRGPASKPLCLFKITFALWCEKLLLIQAMLQGATTMRNPYLASFRKTLRCRRRGAAVSLHGPVLPAHFRYSKGAAAGLTACEDCMRAVTELVRLPVGCNTSCLLSVLYLPSLRRLTATQSLHEGCLTESQCSAAHRFDRTMVMSRYSRKGTDTTARSNFAMSSPGLRTIS